MATTITSRVYDFSADDGATWTDISADVLADSVQISIGITGGGPQDNVASSGSCSFDLRNDGVSGVQGRYSVGSATVMTGWATGVRFRVRWNGATRFIGKIRKAPIDTGIYGPRRVHVVAFDAMYDLAQTDVRSIAAQSGKTETEIGTAVLDSLPANRQPTARDFDDGVDVLPWALDNLGSGTKALAVLNDLSSTTFCLWACKSDGTLIMRNRHNRAYGTSAFSFSANFISLEVDVDTEKVYNPVRVTDRPRTTDASATTVLFAATTPVSVEPGDTIEVWGTYTDPANAQKLVGGTALVAPVSGTDYAANSVADGSGTNYTASLTVTATEFASSVLFTLTNAAPVRVYTVNASGVTKLQVRGKGIYDRGPQTFQQGDELLDTSVPLNWTMTYGGAEGVAANAVQYLYHIWSTQLRQPGALKFSAHESDVHMAFALAVEPGDRVTLTDPMSGLSVLDVVVQSVKSSLIEGTFLTVALGLAPAQAFTAWRAGISKAGIETVPGF